MKHKLYKFMAFTTTAVVIVSMSSCKEEIKLSEPTIENHITEEKNSSKSLENNIALETTTIKIFDDYELNETEPLNEITSNEVTTGTIENEVIIEIPETTTETNQVEVTSPAPLYESRFASTNDYENYLNKIYAESGKNSAEIINEVFAEQETGNYYAYRSDLSAAAAYTIIKEKGYNLSDIEDELNYILACRINPGEITEIEEIVLTKLLIIFDNYTIKDIFQICEQLSLDYHLIGCQKKAEHTEKYGWVYCIELNKDNIANKIVNENPDLIDNPKDNESVLSRKISS